jgi:uncharacterized protein
MIVGTVSALHRFPVKSLGGESLAAALFTERGVLGDRCFALRDERIGELRSARKWPELMRGAARYLEEPRADFTPPVEITLPDGTITRSDAPDVSAVLSRWLASEATLCPLRPASDLEHYRRAVPGAGLATALAKSSWLRKAVARVATIGPSGAEMRDEFGRLPGEPLPDMSVFPAEIYEFVSPPGTYFDAFPIHLLTSASLDAMRVKHPAGDWDVRRFRPNVLVQTSPALAGLIENTWEGKRLRLGDAELTCTVATPRCSMPTQPQAELAKDPQILRTIVREAGQSLGVYARVSRPGQVRVGDPITLE